MLDVKIERRLDGFMMVQATTSAFGKRYQLAIQDLTQKAKDVK